MEVYDKIEKICKSCNVSKTRNEYYINKYGSIKGICKSCFKKQMKDYRESNPDILKKRYERDKEKMLIRQSEFNKKNPEIAKERRLKSKIKNPNYHLEYRKRNKHKINEYLKTYQKNRRKDDCVYKIKSYIVNRTSQMFKVNNWRKNSKTELLLGATYEEVKNHIESLFIDGMNWSNQGYYGWHIDHIIPLSSAKSKEELSKLCHYTNLQPLWRLDNQLKGSKI